MESTAIRGLLDLASGKTLTAEQVCPESAPHSEGAFIHQLFFQLTPSRPDPAGAQRSSSHFWYRRCNRTIAPVENNSPQRAQYKSQRHQRCGCFARSTALIPAPAIFCVHELVRSRGYADRNKPPWLLVRKAIRKGEMPVIRACHPRSLCKPGREP